MGQEMEKMGKLGSEFDMERDLARSVEQGMPPVWFYAAGHSSPGEPRVPLFADIFVRRGQSWGFDYACEKLSLPTTRGNDARNWRGYALVRATLLPEEEAEKRREGLKEGLRPLIENFDQLHKEAKEELWSRSKKNQQFDYQNASWFQLRQKVLEIEEFSRRLLELHVYFLNGLGAAYLLFEELCTDLLGIDDTDPLFQDLIAGFYVRGFETDKAIQGVARRAVELGFGDLFLSTKAGEVIAKLEQSDAGRQWLKEFREFLDVEGWRMPIQTGIQSPTWIEEPTPAIEHIQQFISRGLDFDMEAVIGEKAKRRKEAEKEVLSRVPEERREWFTALMRVAQNYAFYLEENPFYYQMTHATLRYMAMQIGKRLAKAGAIEDAEDILFLTCEEIDKLLVDPYAYSGKKIVKARREEWEENRKVLPPPAILPEGVTIEQAMEKVMMTRDPALITIAIGKMPKPKPEVAKADLIGVPASRGVAEGMARVVFTVEQASAQVRPGDIMVCPGTQSQWTPVFGLIKGVVVDRGGTMTHAAVVAREYGIPCVANVIEGTTKIKTGDRIRVDGNLGGVYILERAGG